MFEFVYGCVGALHVGLLVVGFKGRDYGVDTRYEGLGWGGGEFAGTWGFGFLKGNAVLFEDG